MGASVAVFLAALSLQAAAQESSLDPRPFKPFFTKYCADCHLGGASKGGLDLETLSTDLKDAETLRRWVRVYDRVRSGEMPPPKKERAAAGEQDAFLKPLAATLTRADVARRKVVFRRLNRTEYENTVRDLFGVHADVRELLPEDATAHGFDTMGEALAASAELIQAYLQAADIVLDAAYGSEKEPKRIQLRFPLSKDTKKEIGTIFRETPDGVALFNSGYCPSIARSFNCKDEGTYRVRIHAKGFQSERPVTMSIYAGDVIVKRRPLHLVGHYDLPTDRMTVIEFTDRFGKGDTFHPRPFGTAGSAKQDHQGAGIVIGDVEVEGPLETWPPPSRAALLGGGDPVKGTPEDARGVLTRLLARAFRRTPPPAAVDPFLALVKTELGAGTPLPRGPAGRDQGRPRLAGVPVPPRAARASSTTSPWPAGCRISSGARCPTTSCCSSPAQASLGQPDVLRGQVERMLATRRPRPSPRTSSASGSACGTSTSPSPDHTLYPEFDEHAEGVDGPRDASSSSTKCSRTT